MPKPGKVKARERANAKVAKAVRAREQAIQEEGRHRGHLPRADASSAAASIGHPNAPRTPEKRTGA